MTEETPQAQQIPEHSHDEMYLVYHHRGRVPGETDYLSCHHCGFIKVPKLADLTAQLAEEKRQVEHYRGTIRRLCADQQLQIDTRDATISRLESKVKELKTLNTKAKEVLEKTLDCEASACVARNRLEVQVEQLQSQVKELEKANRRLRDHLENLVYSVAGTEGTKTNAELPEWYRKRLEDAKAVLTRTTPSDSGGGEGK